MLQKLRERMHSRQVYNQSVCNCHEDSELVRMVVTRVIMIIRMMRNMIMMTLMIMMTIKVYQTCFQLSIIDLVESIYSSLDKTSRTFYWQRLQGERISFLHTNSECSFPLSSLTCSMLINLQGRSTSSWRTLTSTWRRRRAFSSLCSTSKENS